MEEEDTFLTIQHLYYGGVTNNDWKDFMKDNCISLVQREVKRVICELHDHWFFPVPPCSLNTADWILSKLDMQDVKNWEKVNEQLNSESHRVTQARIWATDASCLGIEEKKMLSKVHRLICSVRSLILENNRFMLRFDSNLSNSLPDNDKNDDVRAPVSYVDFEEHDLKSFQKLYMILRRRLEGFNFRKHNGYLYSRYITKTKIETLSFVQHKTIKQFIGEMTMIDSDFSAWKEMTDSTSLFDSMVKYITERPLMEAPDIEEHLFLRSYEGDAYGRGAVVYDCESDMAFPYADREHWESMAQYVTALRRKFNPMYICKAPSSLDVCVVHIDNVFPYDIYCELQDLKPLGKQWIEVEHFECLIKTDKLCNDTLAALLASRFDEKEPFEPSVLGLSWVVIDEKCITEDEFARLQAVDRRPCGLKWYANGRTSPLRGTEVHSEVLCQAIAQVANRSGTFIVTFEVSEWNAMNVVLPSMDAYVWCGDTVWVAGTIEDRLLENHHLKREEVPLLCTTLNDRSYISCMSGGFHQNDIDDPIGIDLSDCTGLLEAFVSQGGAPSPCQLRLTCPRVPLPDQSFFLLDGVQYVFEARTTDFLVLSTPSRRTRVELSDAEIENVLGSQRCELNSHTFVSQESWMGRKWVRTTTETPSDLEEETKKELQKCLDASRNKNIKRATEMTSLKREDVSGDWSRSLIPKKSIVKHNHSFYVLEGHDLTWTRVRSPPRNGFNVSPDGRLLELLRKHLNPRESSCHVPFQCARDVIAHDVDFVYESSFVKNGDCEWFVLEMPILLQWHKVLCMHRSHVPACEEASELVRTRLGEAFERAEEVLYLDKKTHKVLPGTTICLDDGACYTVSTERDSTARYFRVDVGRTWRDCETEEVNQIFTCQKFTSHDIFYLHAGFGRTLYPLGHLDKFQFTVMLEGIGGCGKSTLMKAVQAFYAPHHRGILSANIEEKFGLSQVLNKGKSRIICCNEVSEQLSIRQDDWQTACSHEEGSYAVKFDAPLCIVCKAPMFWVGNGYPAFSNLQNQVTRRLFGVLMTNEITPRDSRMGDVIMTKLAQFQRKNVLAYFEFLHQTNGDDPMNKFTLPPHFTAYYERGERKGNPVTACLSNPEYIIVHDDEAQQKNGSILYTRFKEILLKFCDIYNINRKDPKVGEDAIQNALRAKKLEKKFISGDRGIMIDGTMYKNVHYIMGISDPTV